MEIEKFNTWIDQWSISFQSIFFECRMRRKKTDWSCPFVFSAKLASGQIAIKRPLRRKAVGFQSTIQQYLNEIIPSNIIKPMNDNAKNDHVLILFTCHKLWLMWICWQIQGLYCANHPNRVDYQRMSNAYESGGGRIALRSYSLWYRVNTRALFDPKMNWISKNCILKKGNMYAYSLWLLVRAKWMAMTASLAFKLGSAPCSSTRSRTQFIQPDWEATITAVAPSMALFQISTETY